MLVSLTGIHCGARTMRFHKEGAVRSMSGITKVLSIDGGGVRGIIPALILEELESDGTPISRMFDVVAGTSTGGILALGLTLQAKGGRPKYLASDLVKMYKNEATTIFPDSPKYNPWNPVAPWSKLQDLISKPTYDGAGLRHVLKKYFGNARLSDCLAEVLVPAYETVTRTPHLFTRELAIKNSDYDFNVREVATATSAAPTFFPPVKLELGDESKTLTLVDGGVCANNPALLAYRHAVNLFPENKILLVSIGTGKYKRSLHYGDIETWGPLRWAQPIIDVVFDGTDEVTHATAETIFEHVNCGGNVSRIGEGNTYFRWQTDIQADNDRMDNSAAENIAELEAIASRYIKSIQKDLQEVRTFLSSSVP